MVEEIKKRIDKSKNDKTVYREYIKSFCESEKAKELFKNNKEFGKLKPEEKETKEKEDEFF